MDMSKNTFNQPLDALCLARLKKQCRRTQEQVYRLFVGAAWTLAVRLTGCEARAWDAVQEGFVQAFRRAGQVRDGRAFGFWLRRIVVNRVMDGYRIGDRERAEAIREETVDAPDPAWMDLERALAGLDGTDRMVLWLHDAEGMTHDEIASLAGRTVSWSKTRLSRTRARLRLALDDEKDWKSGKVQHGK